MLETRNPVGRTEQDDETAVTGDSLLEKSLDLGGPWIFEKGKSSTAHHQKMAPTS